ncbi:MAG: DUF2914 domain-containing protein [Elusimicrobiota bacterium]
MKKALLAATFAVISGYAYAQTPAQEPDKALTVAKETKQTPTPGIKVEKMVTAAAVDNKEPVNETSSFDKTIGRVYTWARITTTVTPVKIKHVYYADEKKAAEIELSVNAKTYRVWSYKSVWPGTWKVETTDEAGKVLAVVTFTVSSAAPVQTPEAETPTQGK